MQTNLNSLTFPSGFVVDYIGSALPSGWLWCDGGSHDPAVYPNLAAALNYQYGGIVGVSFNVPDLRGRTTAGRDDMGGTAASRITTAGSSVDGTTLGAAGGSEAVTLDVSHMPTTHLHSGSISSSTDISHTHTLTNYSGAGISGTYAPFGASAFDSTRSTNATDIAHTHTGGYSGTAGGSSAHANLQPSIVVNKIIKI